MAVLEVRAFRCSKGVLVLFVVTAVFDFPKFIRVGFPCGSAGEESVCNMGDLSSIPELGRSPAEGNGYPLQCSGLENSLDKEAWQATVHGVAESQAWPSDFRSHFQIHHVSLCSLLHVCTDTSGRLPRLLLMTELKSPWQPRAAGLRPLPWALCAVSMRWRAGYSTGSPIASCARRRRTCSENRAFPGLSWALCRWRALVPGCVELSKAPLDTFLLRLSCACFGHSLVCPKCYCCSVWLLY